MSKSPLVLILSLIVVVVFGTFIGILCGEGGSRIVIQVSGITFSSPIFTFCVFLAFIINWLAYIPAAIAKTERYYDLIGSMTFLTMIVVSVYFSPSLDWRAIMVAMMVSLWALRLGLFLFKRVLVSGHDGRFNEIKINPLKFLLAWTLQALWAVVTASCALVIISSERVASLDFITIAGIVMWFFGFLVEVIADYQKYKFRESLNNEKKFINSGLWAWSQHPNYFGEIVLWCGILLISMPVLIGWQWISIISPIFVWLLLTRGSGIPTLESKAMSLWGDDKDYQSYIANTPLLFPLKPKR